MTTDLTIQDEFDIGIDISDMMMIIMMVVMVTLVQSVATLSAQVNTEGEE